MKTESDEYKLTIYESLWRVRTIYNSYYIHNTAATYCTCIYCTFNEHIKLEEKNNENKWFVGDSPLGFSVAVTKYSVRSGRSSSDLSVDALGF